MFVTMTGFTTPGVIARYDFRSPEDSRWSIYRTTLVKNLNPDDFISEQVRIYWAVILHPPT